MGGLDDMVTAARSTESYSMSLCVWIWMTLSLSFPNDDLNATSASCLHPLVIKDAPRRLSCSTSNSNKSMVWQEIWDNLGSTDNEKRVFKASQQVCVRVCVSMTHEKRTSSRHFSHLILALRISAQPKPEKMLGRLKSTLGSTVGLIY